MTRDTGDLLDISPWVNPGDSHPHEWAFLLHWRKFHLCHHAHRPELSPPQAFAFRKPCGSSHFARHLVRGSCTRQVWKERCILVEHASAFTQASDLAWNPQTLFRCQGTRTRILQRGSNVKRSGLWPCGADILPAGSHVLSPYLKQGIFNMKGFDKWIYRA
jgi:hypothetical protein